MRLAEKYIAALNETYSTAKIVVLPPTTNSSGMSPASIATALTLFGQLSGQRITDSSRQDDHTSEAMEKVLSSLKNLSENGRKEAINKVKFLDDKALYQ